ncbi:serine/threonine-protein kinase [Aquipseudomonas ullengensis]|uniref:mitogen-activated protein kinase kinase n=1 Tax=Aquipseudomonas ullengensis TaxID=2759166 RepID=A0A7W4QDF1_9GAMM|nr:serine/threonine-protein kinase [Pseudomonas ullengensis]MBB2494478.1 serine/threonine protein kinase [Pseudomonas ullengensis]
MQGLPDRYQPIGSSFLGGMGGVIPCTDTVLERQVAIKFIKSSIDQRRMLDELAALMRVRSKHVVQVYDIVNTTEFGTGIVQEYIFGEDLIDGFVPPKDEITYYKNIWQIASGISDIHDAGTIHRDIKPNNMKLDPEGVIKIYDFGLSRQEGFNAATVGFIGTHGFAAPELYGESPKFTSAVDVYGFGATALFLALGSVPKELVCAYDKPVSRHHFNLTPLNLAPEIQSILNDCLHYSPEQRPPISAIKAALAKHILLNQHQALVVHKGVPTYLTSKNPSTTLEFTNIGKATIEYNGTDFIVIDVSGEVLINNRVVSNGAVLPGSCVVALGSPARRANEREFITFDISNPEITI